MRIYKSLPLAALLVAGAFAANAQVPAPFLSKGSHFEERDGASLYAHVCAACHQADGRGAIGAGAYPALAQNENLASGGYPVTVLLQGLRAMPPLGRAMSDQQVADVVVYIRTHFGNHYGDAISADDVRSAR